MNAREKLGGCAYLSTSAISVIDRLVSERRRLASAILMSATIARRDVPFSDKRRFRVLQDMSNIFETSSSSVSSMRESRPKTIFRTSPTKVASGPSNGFGSGFFGLTFVSLGYCLLSYIFRPFHSSTSALFSRFPIRAFGSVR